MTCYVLTLKPWYVWLNKMPLALGSTSARFTQFFKIKYKDLIHLKSSLPPLATLAMLLAVCSPQQVFMLQSYRAAGLPRQPQTAIDS